MPFVRRSDSWLYVSDSTRLRHGAGTAARGHDDPLAQFPSETTSHVTTPHETIPQMMIVPGRSIAECVPIHHSTRDMRIASHSGTRLHRSKRRALMLVAPLPTIVRELRGRSIKAIRIPPLMERVRDLRRLSASTTLTSFGGGAAAGVLVMWFAGAQPALPGGPSTTQAVTLTPTLPPPDPPASPPNVQLAAEGMRPRSASPQSSVAASVPRPIGTSGPGADNSNRAARPSRVAASVSKRPGKAAAAPRAPYRGSLAFRSTPEGARVFVNGTFVGSTPLTLENLPVGSRAVRIEADGYQRWSASTQVVANRQGRVSATLGRAVP